MSKIRPDIANRRIESFRKRFGKAHLYLAYHAAFPSVLTPDLLYRLWANFQQDIHGEVLAIPWVGVADLLLSNLCDEVGHELYEIDLSLRKQLLRHLKEDPDFGQQRLDEIANFLLDYIHPQLRSHDPDIQDFAQAQRWTALAYIHPSKATHELALTLSKLDQKQDKTEILRLASLVETVAEPLAEFKSLLVYTRGMASFVRGDLENAATQFSTVFIDNNHLQVAGIILLVPEQILKAIGGVQETSLNQVRKSQNKKNTSSILKLFNRQLPSKQSIYKREVVNKVETLPSRLNLNTLIFVCLFVTTLIIGIRFLGSMQTLELIAYDQMMRSRPDEGQDSRLLLVTIDDADLALQRHKGEELKRTSLSDESLTQLIVKLQQHKPLAIGLDIYRDFPAKNPALIPLLQNTDNLIGVCKGSNTTEKTKGIAPPKEIPKNRLGFSDFIHDRDGVLRRHLLFMTQEAASLCPTPYALSTQLAFRYLVPRGIQPTYTAKNELKLGKIIFPRLSSRASGYQSIDAKDGQVLLNYRSTKKIAEQVTLTQLLSDQVNPDTIKGKIVLIGVSAKGDFPDYWATPYGNHLDMQMPGVIVQAHMVSQILSAVLDGRPLLTVWSAWIEIAWIGCWAFLGGILVQRFQHLLTLGLAGGIAIAILYIFCFGLLIGGYWIPFVPPAFTFVFAGLVVQYQKYLLKRQELLKNNVQHNLASKN